MLGGIGEQEKKGTTEDEMARWHHWVDGRESEWTPGIGDGQGGLACCDSWGCKESDTSERLNWTELKSVVPNMALFHSPLGSFKIKQCLRPVLEWPNRQSLIGAWWWRELPQQVSCLEWTYPGGAEVHSCCRSILTPLAVCDTSLCGCPEEGIAFSFAGDPCSFQILFQNV